MKHYAPESFALTVLLGLLTALGPLSTDQYLPSLPSIARDFHAASGEAQLTLSAYLIGYALGLPVYGPVSDRRGRKPVLAFGLGLFILANIAAALAPNLWTLILSRLVQGISVAAPLVVARAVVRDIYEGRHAGQQLARMGAIMGIVPALAPLIGVVLETSFGWRSNFVFCAGVVIMLAWLVMQRLPETLATPNATPLSFGPILKDFGQLLRDNRFLPFAATGAFTYSGLFAYISGSSFIYQNQFGLSPFGFGLAFVAMVGGFLLGTTICQKLALKYPARVLIRFGAWLMLSGGLLMVLGHWAFPRLPAALGAPMMLYSCGVGFSLSQSMASAMMPFPERAGTVSSLMGVVQMTTAAIIGSAVGNYIEFTPYVLAGTVLGCALMTTAFATKIGKTA